MGWRPLLLWLLYSAAVITAVVGVLVLLHHDLNGAASGMGALALIGLYSYWRQTADYRRLSPSQRGSCRQVQRTGVPSADADVNRVARDLLETRARSWQRNAQILTGCIVAALVAVPVVVASTGRPAWWALTLPVVLFAGVVAQRRMRGPDPRKALARLDTRPPDGEQPWRDRAQE